MDASVFMIPIYAPVQMILISEVGWLIPNSQLILISTDTSNVYWEPGCNPEISKGSLEAGLLSICCEMLGDTVIEKESHPDFGLINLSWIVVVLSWTSVAPILGGSKLDKHNRLTSGELLSNDRQAVGFIGS